MSGSTEEMSRKSIERAVAPSLYGDNAGRGLLSRSTASNPFGNRTGKGG